ncbi:hypothetical protein H6P81_021091 [Aristolochia fimbriata]|uniref:Uncharacterized protein n=1 Tax=Aristolochia fimbriata TaxID=158543 RepID=A0AAV7DZ90_ARIFI|nr:hypothetical protein H6P81_021091 [Aristolochia fimbriata]
MEADCVAELRQEFHRKTEEIKTKAEQERVTSLNLKKADLMGMRWLERVKKRQLLAMEGINKSGNPCEGILSKDTHQPHFPTPPSTYEAFTALNYCNYATAPLPSRYPQSYYPPSLGSLAWRIISYPSSSFSPLLPPSLQLALPCCAFKWQVIVWSELGSLAHVRIGCHHVRPVCLDHVYPHLPNMEGTFALNGLNQAEWELAELYGYLRRVIKVFQAEGNFFLSSQGHKGWGSP